ncbi:uncharacterized protein [Garra rufa]|uniref:uncharacterized protein n=1 Tax=Garra rufa TaxID=137080 RepID=UPI003CCE8F11
MAANDTASNKDTPVKDNTDNLSMSRLISELAKQRASLKEDMASLIQDSIKPLQTSVDTLRETVGSFQHRLTSTEILAGENFERLVAAEATIKSLKAQNVSLLDQIDDLENRSRRANLRIINIPEGSEDGKDPVGFVSGLLKDTMESVFDSPPELERAHRALRPKPGAGQPPRPFIVCFHRYQEKERALQWARRHDVKFNDSRSADPCYNYTALDNSWRASNRQSSSRTCDTSFTWRGWYRLFLYGLSVKISDTCVMKYRCGTDIPLWIRDGHPRVEDGVVSRDVCGHWNNYCCFYGSYPIKVKACPGNYYVYELVSPTVCTSAYCADASSINTSSTSVTPATISTDFRSVDPCYNYTSLDNSWRASNRQSSSRTCDQAFTWRGWYRLFLHGLSVRISDTCVMKYRCGTDIPLWIRGGHPRFEDGVVSRDVCAHWNNYCCYYGSYPIKVKACPGNYYVYELVRPTVCNSAYCADVSSINTSSTAIIPAMLLTDYYSADPCYNYTVLDEPWRAISNTNYYYYCDNYVTWSGWYRLFINGVSAQIPDTCVSYRRCGTDIPLWISGGHPTVTDGVVTRDVCGNWDSNCCYYVSYSIKVKACSDNYYVYELVKPNYCYSAYCADVGNITTSSTTITPTAISTGLNITLVKVNKDTENLLNLLENITVQVLPLNDVTKILDVVLNVLENALDSSSADPNKLLSIGNRMLKASEQLVSMLVKPTSTSDSVNFTLDTVEGRIFMVGPQLTLDKIPQLDAKKASVDIDLIGIARNNNETGTAAVAFMSYNMMENLLKPDFFNTPKDTIKTMMSTVISVTLPRTTNTKLTKPVNFTFRHIREFDPSGSLSCVYWNINEWIVDGCSVLETNSSYTVCSCDRLSTFALIMQTSRPPESDSQLMKLLNLVCVIVGLVFFSLALLSFALCRWSPGVNNVARINICISLLLAHLLFLLTQQFLSVIRPQQVLCAVISGLLHFLFLSGFVWMFIEAVMLFIRVRNLLNISSRNREVLRSGFLCMIGYLVALVMVSVSVVLVPGGYGSKHCWIKIEKGFIWSFLGPVCVILALNVILFIMIVITLNSILKNLNAEVSQINQTKIVYSMTLKLLSRFVVLGCPWILGFFTNDSKELEFFFLVVNSQQGTFIFLIYCVLNREVRQEYKKFFRCLCCGCKHR